MKLSIKQTSLRNIVLKTEPYLARPYVNIYDPRNESEAQWMTESNKTYARALFSRRVVTHPIYVSETIDKAPIQRIPQVALVGYSNVGKSSLINAILYGKHIPNFARRITSNAQMLKNPRYAPVSRTPGRTRHLFTFDLGNKISLVDLPGYGCAKVSDVSFATEIQITTNTGTKERLVSTVNLKLIHTNSLYRILSLVDSIKGPVAEDYKLWSMLRDMQIPFQVVLTKCDRVKPEELHLQYSKLIEMLKEYENFDQYVYATSATRNLGIDELRLSLSHIALTKRAESQLLK
nr:hypothetical protein MACL_00003183 [Theileria orientalis]